MTEQQNTIIHNMREQNFSYLAIARAMGALPYQPSRATVKGADLQGTAKKHSGAILLNHRYCHLSADAAASSSPKKKKLNAVFLY